MKIVRKPCAQQNFRDGRQGHDVEAIVIHIVDGGIAGCDATFASSSLTLRRSAHYCVAKTGVIHQYVDEEDTAFHAGRVQNPVAKLVLAKTLPGGGFVNPNLYTIGIEHEGRATDAWPDSQYEASAELLADISDRYPALNDLSRASNVILHREIFSGKSCPGFVVDLDRLLSLAKQKKHAIAAVARAEAVGGGGATVLSVRVLSPVRVRTDTTTSARVLRVLPAGRVLAGVAARQGTAVDGNATWYRIAENEYIWAGATDRPGGK